MSNLWVTFSTDSSGSFTELSGNIIYNLNNLYNFNGNLVDTTSDFIIYELSNNPIQGNVSLQANNWKQLTLNNNLAPFQGYWLGGINTNLPQPFSSGLGLIREVNNWLTNPIPVTNIYGLIENWNVGNVRDMSTVFMDATSFDGNISNWDVGNVRDMSSMFNKASSFNQDISNWDVGNVRDMDGMFFEATSFDGNISNWDVGNVTEMISMFRGASSFNQDISNWNVGNVTSMYKMFSGANNFNQDISNWNVVIEDKADLDRMFENVTFFTDMTDKIDSNGTPFYYFMSQRNNTTSVTIRAYDLLNYSETTGTVLSIADNYSDGPDNNFNRIKNALSITSMDELTNYSFRSSEDFTIRDILSVWQTSTNTSGIVYYYNISGAIINQRYFIPNGPYTLIFTRRT